MQINVKKSISRVNLHLCHVHLLWVNERDIITAEMQMNVTFPAEMQMNVTFSGRNANERDIIKANERDNQEMLKLHKTIISARRYNVIVFPNGDFFWILLIPCNIACLCFGKSARAFVNVMVFGKHIRHLRPFTH